MARTLKVQPKTVPADKPAKAKSYKLEWASHPNWTWRAIRYLIAEPKFRLKLFSDSQKKAKEESREKESNKDGKSILFGQLAAAIFQPHAEDLGDSDELDEELSAAYGENTTAFNKSTQQQFARLKSKYREYARRLSATGGGVEGSDAVVNLAEKIREEWPFWDDLHAMWKELPNYNPIAVSNSAAGAAHATTAEALFKATSNSAEDNAHPSSGLEDAFKGVADDKSDPEESSDAESDDEDAPSTPTRPSHHSTVRASVKRSPRLATLAAKKKVKVSHSSTLVRGNPSSEKKPPPKYGQKRGADLLESLSEETAQLERRRAEKDKIRAREIELKIKRTELEARKLEMDAQSRAQDREMMMRVMMMVGGGAGPSTGMGMSSYVDRGGQLAGLMGATGAGRLDFEPGDHNGTQSMNGTMEFGNTGFGI